MSATNILPAAPKQGENTAIVPNSPTPSASPISPLPPMSPTASASPFSPQSTTSSSPPPSPAMTSSSLTSTAALASPSSSTSSNSLSSGKFIQPTLPPFLESPLWKKGSTFGGWTKRWYTFHPELSRIYYSKEEKGPIRGEIIVTRFTVRPLDQSDLANQFLIDSPNRAYILRAEDSHTAQEWIDALTDLQQANTGRNKESMLEVSKATNVAIAAQRCANCHVNFGLLKRPVICASCALAFCNSLKCMEAKSLKNASMQKRCCVTCAEARDNNNNNNGSSPSLNSASSMIDAAGKLIKSGSSSAGAAIGALFGSTSAKTKPSNSNLLIRIISGKQLMACDAGGTSDPYCVIFFNGEEYKTEVQWKTLHPVWNQQYNIPITGQSKDIQIGVYDSDRYSNDDFMGMVHIPLSDLETDRVYEDFFPLKPRPGKKADKELPISGVLHLQIIKTESLFALFAPIWENSLQPEEKYSQAVLKHNVKRIQAILESINLSWYQAKMEEILNYTYPLQSLLFILTYSLLVLFYPSEWILPTLPILLLMKMMSNFIEDQKRIIGQLEETSAIQQKLGLWNGTAASSAGTAADSFLQQHHAAGTEEGSLSGEGAMGHHGAGSGAEGVDDDADYEEEEEEEEEGNDERTMAIGFLGKIKQYQKQLAKIQTVIGKACDKLEAVQNLFRWYDKRRSKLVALVLILAFFFLLLVPVRVLLFLGGVAKWSKKLVGIVKKKLPKGKKPSEVENFLERSPTTISLNPSKIHLVKKLKDS